mgnify:FL=1|jgi:hypothetical protein
MHFIYLIFFWAFIMCSVFLIFNRKDRQEDLYKTIKKAKKILGSPNNNMFEHPIIIDIEDYTEKNKKDMLTYSHLGKNIPELYNGKFNET